jgi:hypothetical protein
MLMTMPGRAMVSMLVLVLIALTQLQMQPQPQAQTATLESRPDPQPRRPPQMPTRDRRDVPRTGTGRIRGRVVDAISGQPLVHAAVRLTSPVTGRSLAMVTDTSGAFGFDNLPPGASYYISASKPGYLNATFPDGQRSLRRTNGLTLEDGQTLDSITVPVSHGSAITGRLFDAYGDPAEFVSVQVVRAPNTRNMRGGFQMGQTNDAGEFRVGRLEPGTYLVFATPRGFPGADVESEPNRLVPTFYPGVLNPDEAQPITVERGQTLSGIEFQVLEQPMSTVTGLVLDASGRPAMAGNVNAQIQFGIITASRASSQIHGDGSFELKLPPGEYRLLAYVPPPADASKTQGSDPSGGPRPTAVLSGPNGGTVIGGVVRGNPGPGEQQQGMQRLTVGANAISNVTINAGYGGTISGRVLFDGDAAPPAPSKITVNGMTRRPITFNVQFDGSDECRNSDAKGVKDDYTFTIESVRGSCAINVAVLDAGGWRARTAMYRNVDLLDRPIEVWGNQSVRDVVITMTNKRTDLSAEVTDDQGMPTLDYLLVAFSTDKARWASPRHVVFIPSSTPSPSPAATAQGGFGATAAVAAINGAMRGGSRSMTSPPAGEYYVIAIDDATAEDIHDPVFLDQLVPGATRVTLREGEPQKLQLRRQKAPARQ